MENKAYLVPNPMTPCQNLIIDPELCTSCLACVNVCRTDVLVPNPEEKQRYSNAASFEPADWLEAKRDRGIFPDRHEESATSQYEAPGWYETNYEVKAYCLLRQSIGVKNRCPQKIPLKRMC
jgi:formate hydrogenlyase subunit 6/NADH:ubiquinone oxidoreductase subunit I